MEYQECVVSERDDSNIECFDGDKITVTAQVHQVEERSAINDAKENRNTRGDNEISIVLQEQEEKTELEILKTSEFQENDNLKDMSERENSNIGLFQLASVTNIKRDLFILSVIHVKSYILLFQNA
jgi:hypothetical protein